MNKLKAYVYAYSDPIDVECRLEFVIRDITRSLKEKSSINVIRTQDGKQIIYMDYGPWLNLDEIIPSVMNVYATYYGFPRTVETFENCSDQTLKLILNQKICYLPQPELGYQHGEIVKSSVKVCYDPDMEIGNEGVYFITVDSCQEKDADTNFKLDEFFKLPNENIEVLVPDLSYPVMREMFRGTIEPRGFPGPYG